MPRPSSKTAAQNRNLLFGQKQELNKFKGTYLKSIYRRNKKMANITFYKHDPLPLEMHKVKIVQKLNLLPAEERLQKMYEAGFNTFQLRNKSGRPR